MVRQLARLGHKVKVYALHPDYAGLEQKSCNEANFQVQYVSPMHVRKQGNRKIYYRSFKLLLVAARATFSLSRAALRERSDVIWIGKPHPMNGIAGLVGKAIWGCPLILDCDDDETGSGTFHFEWQRKVVRWFENLLPDLATKVTVNTRHMFANIAARGVAVEKIIYLPNGVDAERFLRPVDLSEVGRLKNTLNLTGKHVISYIGTMSVSSHAVDLLIEAFSKLIAQRADVFLMLVGGGEDFDLLSALVNKLGLGPNVVFIGRVQPDQVMIYYQISDLTVDPIYNNNAAKGRSPLKMFESWASGVPLVTSPVGDRTALAGDPPAALFVKAGDVSALAEGLNNLLDNSTQRKELISLGRTRIREFTWEHLIERLNCILPETLSKLNDQ